MPRKQADTSCIKIILFLTMSIELAFTNPSYEYKYINYTNQFQLPDHVYPMHYKVKLTVNSESTNRWVPFHKGQVDINVRILVTNPVLILNRRQLDIEQSWTKLTSLSNKNFSILGFHALGYDTEALVTYFKEPVPLGNYSLHIRFKSISKDNFFQSYSPRNTTLYPQNERLILTHFGKIAIRQLFPCWDHPMYKTTFDIAVKHFEKYTVLSNMPLLKRSNTNDETMIQSRFYTTPKMSIRQLVIILMPFTTIPEKFQTFYTWCKSNTMLNMLFARNIAYQVPNHLFQYTQISSGMPKIDHIAIWNVPHSEAYWGLIIYREIDIIYDKKKDSIDIKIEVANTVASLVAQQWFGGLITPHSFHTWLSKSLAMFFAHYAVDQIHKEWTNIFLTVVSNLHFLLIEDNNSIPPVLFDETKRNFEDSYYIYLKGSVLLRMLHHITGEKAFQKGVIEFLNKHKYGVATTDDLWSTLQAALDATSELQVDIKKVMDSWITQTGFPLVTVTRDYVTGQTIIWQQPYNIYDISGIISHSKWWIPITWTTESSPTFHNTTPILWLEPENEISITTNPDEWIIVNLQQTGYYRVHYDRTNWEKIGIYLKSESYSNIHIVNRAQVINDICDMFQNEQIGWTLFSFVTSYLTQETNYIPWITMVKCLDELAVFFLFPESREFQMHFASYFDGILNKIGYEEDPNDDDLTRLAREDLALYACFLGNPTCRNTAGDILKKYIADPTKHQIPSRWEHWTFCYGLKTTNIKTWHKILRIYEETKDKRILNSLLCTEHIGIIIEFINKIVKNDIFIEKADLPDFISNVIKEYIHIDQLFYYALKELVLLKFVSTDYIFDKIIENLYCEEKLDELSQYIRIFTNDFLYDNKIEQRRQEIRALKKDFVMIFNKTI